MSKECSTPGCSEGINQKASSHSSSVCSNCGEILREEQIFCPKCGTEKMQMVQKHSYCNKCGSEIGEGISFCPRCGQKVGLEVPQHTASAIDQYNQNVYKTSRRNKTLPIILAVILCVAVVVGVIANNVIKENKRAAAALAAQQKAAAEKKEFLDNANKFSTQVISAGVNLENIANEIKKEWYDSIWNDTYDLVSIDDAIANAQRKEAGAINYAKTDKSNIDALYKKLKTPPANDASLTEISDAIKDLYSAYSDFYDFAMNPNGSLNSYSSEFTSKDNTFSSKYKALSNLLK